MPPETTGGIFGREETVMQINKQALREIIPDSERLLFEENIPAEYLSDALGRRTGTADALVFALSTEEVSGVLRYANENGIPVTPRGAGTNLSGGTIPDRSDTCSVVLFWMYPV